MGLFLLPPPLAIAAGWVGGGPRSTPAVAPALGSGAGLKGHIQIRDCLRPVPGQGPGQLLGYLGCWAGCRHGCPQPSPLLHQERCPGAGRAQPGCWAASPGTNGAFFYFLLMTFLFSLGGLRSGISRNHHGMSFLRRKQSPRLLPRGWRLAPLVTPRGILSPWTRRARYSWVQTCHPAAGFWLFRLRSLLTA